MTPVKRAKTEHRLVVVWNRDAVDGGTKPTKSYSKKRNLKHAQDDAANYDEDKPRYNPRRSVHIETRTVTEWVRVEEE